MIGRTNLVFTRIIQNIEAADTAHPPISRVLPVSMRKIFTPNDYLLSSPRTDEGSRKKPHDGGASSFQDIDSDPSIKWEEPWLATGQTEPGWWRAFAIDHGVRSTRTPDKLIRKPQETNVFDLPTGEPMEAGRLAEITPPVGVVLFVTSKIANISFEAMSRAIIPWLVPLLAVLAAITLWPPLTTWLPNLVLGR
jgi:hypothetical protein